jgi:tRNA A-37 threonylcarbamoyl transferase component Bud32
MGPQICPACGTATEPEARFCGVCGSRLPPKNEPALDATIPDLRRMDPVVKPLPAKPAHPPAPLHGSHQPAHQPAPAYQPPAPSPVRPPASQPHGPARAASPGGGVPAGIPAGSAKPRSMSPPATTAAGERVGRSRLNMPKPVLPSLDRLMGRTLNGRYLVERKIGEGGFGAVFRGRQVATGREVALKILHPHNVSDATVVARFRREAEACSKLTNVHTVVIYDFDETEDGVLYLAMELLRGRPLQDVERSEGPLEPRRVLGIIGQVAEALGEAHAQGVVHRDMKPENVMIEARDGEDFVKVLDFGIAKLAEQGGKAVPALTAVGQTLGTLEFMSPEQLRGRGLDGRSDLYALGIMAYEMLTGLLPWREARVPIDVIKFHLETIPPSPSTLRRDLDIPREVDDLVGKMVAKDPGDRHADAAELRQHIDHVLSVLERRGSRGRTLRVLAVAAGLMVLLAAVGIAFLR